VYNIERVMAYTQTFCKSPFWLDLKQCKIDATDSLIEANYFASKTYDPNIWNIKPNELPTFVK